MTAYIMFLKRIDIGLKILLITILSLLVVDVTWQVVTRFILPKPSSFTEEIARFLLIWLSLFGGAYAYRLSSHLGFDLLVNKLSIVKAKFVFRVCTILVAIFAFSVLIVGGGNLVYLTWILGQSSPVLNIPMAFIYCSIPLSGFLFLLYSVFFFVTGDTSIYKEVN